LTKSRIAILLAVPLVGLLVFLAIGVKPAPIAPRPPPTRASGPLGNGWQKYDFIVSPGDWDQKPNGAPDVIARAASDGSAWLFSGDGLGGYTRPTRIAKDWRAYTELVGVGNFRSHNGPGDLMAVRSDGTLVLIPNVGHGVMGTPRVVGRGFGGYDVILGAGDFNGDGTQDVIARNASDGTLILYAGDGKGGFLGHSLISPASFSGYSLLTTPGDWDNDNYPDLVARSPDGTLCLFRSNDRGGLQNTNCIPIGSGWNAFNAIVAPGTTWDQDNERDLLARTPDGGLWLATGFGLTGYSDPLSLTQCSAIGLHISSVTPDYTITFQRYGQTAPETLATLSETNGQIRAIPADAASNGARWPESLSYSDTCAWKSGLYAAQLTATSPIASTGASLNQITYITFVVKPLTPPTTRQLLVVASTNTWTAYNDWPQDSSFYDRKPGGRPTQVSYLRPNPSASPLAEGSSAAGGELQILKWLEAHNFAYQMITDVDLNDSPSLLSTSNYYAVLLSTHSEYWTNPMFNALAKYLQDGGSVLSLSGNTMYRKETLAKPSQSAQWSSLLVGGVNPIRNPFAIGNLIGLQFVSTIDTCAPYRVTSPRSWLMAGVSKRTIGPTGQYWTLGCFLNAAGIPAGASGREVDKRLPFLLNRRYEVVAVGANPKRGADLVWYLRRDGGQVVNVGSITFGNSLAIDPNLSIIVTNALNQFMRFHDSGQSSFGGLIAPGDWDGDGRPDILARGGDKLYLYRANGTAPMGGPTLISTGWAQYNLIAPAGNWMGHARPDLFARRASDGALFVEPNSGFGSFASRLRIGASIHWSNYDTILGVGDWNGDHISDLVARTPSGDMYLYTGLGGGRINPTPTLLATGWDSYDQIISPVDWNGDGRPDLVARKPDGSMWVALGRRDHTLAAPQEMPGTNGWDKYSTILSGGDWNANGRPDLVARRADGSMWVFPGNGQSVGGPFLIAQHWNVFS
jgi:N,N-dimethylformamidase beta subunit-like, C-terminal/FG-GAP-like repeat